MASPFFFKIIFHTMAEVVNVKVAQIRPQYENLREWMRDGGNVYIGRRGVVFIDGTRYPAYHSVWANPFKVTAACSRQDAIDKYESYIRDLIAAHPRLYNLEALRGKRLGCWCHPAPCHGDVLARLLNETQ